MGLFTLMRSVPAADKWDMTDRSLETLEFQTELLKLSGLAREIPHTEIKTIANLSAACRDAQKHTADAVQNRA